MSKVTYFECDLCETKYTSMIQDRWFLRFPFIPKDFKEKQRNLFPLEKGIERTLNDKEEVFSTYDLCTECSYKIEEFLSSKPYKKVDHAKS